VNNLPSNTDLKNAKSKYKVTQYLHYNIVEPHNEFYKLLLKVNPVTVKISAGIFFSIVLN